MWFREYVYNVLIQPFHYLLYTILVGSALTLAHTHMIYAMCAIGFLLPAENLLRNFFGFNKAGTLSAAGSFAGGAAFMALANRIRRPKPKDEGDKDKNKYVRKANSGGGTVSTDDTLVKHYANTPKALPKGNKDNDKDNKKTSNELLEGDNKAGKKEKTEDDAKRLNTGGNTDQSNDTDADGQELSIEQPETNNNNINNSNEGQENKSDNDTNTPNNETRSDNSVNEDTSWKEAKEMKRKDRLFPNWDKKGERFKDNRVGQTIGDYARSVGYRTWTGAGRTLKNQGKSLPRKFRRIAIGGTVGGAVGLAGVAVGVASGDPSKAFQYGAAGAAAGYYGANYYGDKAAKTVSRPLKAASTAAWGADSRKRQEYKYDENFKKDPDNIDALAKALGSRDAAKEAMKNGDVQALLNNGVTNISTIGKALKLKKRYETEGDKFYKKELNEKQRMELAIATAKLNDRISSRVLDRSSEEYGSFVNYYKKKGIEKSKIDEIVDELDYIND